MTLTADTSYRQASKSERGARRQVGCWPKVCSDVSETITHVVKSHTGGVSADSKRRTRNVLASIATRLPKRRDVATRKDCCSTTARREVIPMAQSDFVTVSREHPCPICEKPDWCSASRDGRVVCCGRVDQGSIRQNDDGRFLHFLWKREDSPEWPRREIKPRRSVRQLHHLPGTANSRRRLNGPMRRVTSAPKTTNS